MARVEREVRILGKKLERSEANRRKLELDGDRSNMLHRRVIDQLQRKEEALRRSEAAAQQANRVKSEFLANVSHEIRTPMNGLLGMTELLLDCDPNPRQRELATKILRSATSLMHLIDDVLDFSKIEAGRLELDAVELDLVDVLEDATLLYCDTARTKGVELVCAIDPAPAVVGDPMRLRQVVTNLVSNAVKFTEAGFVSVHSTCRQSEDGGRLTLRVEVRDSGVGLVSGSEHLLFEPFTQADGSATRRFGGTGLGLAIVRELVELMGGTYGAQGAPGDGARFWFQVSLPVVPGAVLDRSLDGRTIAVVSASERQRSALSATLTRLGAKICAFSDLPAPAPEVDAALVDGRPEGRVALARGQYPRLLAMAPDEAQGDSLRAAGADAVVGVPPRQAELLRALGVARPAPVASKRGAEAELAGITVLVAEDNPINREVAVAALRRLGCDVVAVEDGAQAVDVFARREFDLVLLDCQMPVMDGFEAASRIRSCERARLPPIVAMTANVLRRDRERCAAAGMVDVLSKPYTLAGLRTIVRRWTGS